jgi:hypothetical protein
LDTSRAEENFLSDGKKTSGQERKNISEQSGRKLPVKSGRIFPPSKTNISNTEYSKTNKSKTEYKSIGAGAPECSAELALALKSFEEHRKKLKKPMTDRAKELLLCVPPCRWFRSPQQARWERTQRVPPCRWFRRGRRMMPL